MDDAPDSDEQSAARVQGWTEAQYVRLASHTNRLIEYTDGMLDTITPPTDQHQAVVAALFVALREYLVPRGGKVRFAPMRVRIRLGMFRTPDLMVLCRADDPRRLPDYWDSADLVIEVASIDNPERDTRTKRHDYAVARIPEYWIVYLAQQQIAVLRLDGSEYTTQGIYGRGDQAHSVMLPRFAVDVSTIIDGD